jgi:hypothetical protein
MAQFVSCEPLENSVWRPHKGKTRAASGAVTPLKTRCDRSTLKRRNELVKVYTHSERYSTSTVLLNWRHDEGQFRAFETESS